MIYVNAGFIINATNDNRILSDFCWPFLLAIMDASNHESLNEQFIAV